MPGLFTPLRFAMTVVRPGFAAVASPALSALLSSVTILVSAPPHVAGPMVDAGKVHGAVAVGVNALQTLASLLIALAVNCLVSVIEAQPGGALATTRSIFSCTNTLMVPATPA